ncbi:Crp/Fnr family transcriptional regulator [Hymenobacter jeollabukensis]|uniref:Crp/Fnr family transcriptional regulator n=1 Tax=Hymenobacter jeollabukensis TaxID=2025313 RepID=A0A5R8WNA7_9BACT|nr:Crp/Fnr family transcriptional regulator [Hymenobacter jeollabukensis]TLM91116.1 Crp/Fnr family transcriptional regulator [Hymenobacter jeollabukensis]
MMELLRAHLARFIELPEADWESIQGFFELLDVGKKANLLVQGELCQAHYFVAQGCLRLYFVNDKGTEQTTQFALEGWWLTDYAAFGTSAPATFGIQAVEKSTVLAISFAGQEQLLHEFPRLERYFRLIHQRAHAASQFRIKGLYSLSGEERYWQFHQRQPAFVQRVPQYLLASYLGITPEYLSEIRGRRHS